MSTSSARKVVGRAVLDAAFRVLLFSNPAEALKGYELTAGEAAALNAIPPAMLDGFASQLEERISMSLLAFGAEDGGGDAGSGDEGDGDGSSWLPRLAGVLGVSGNTGAGGAG